MFAKNTEEKLRRNSGICKFYLLSSCTKGRKCPFLHDMPNSIGRRDPCYFFLKGRCNDGESCQRSHREPPSFNGTIKKVCLYFSQDRCNRGKLCSYSHDLPLRKSTDSESSQSESINFVSPVIINTSDDLQSIKAASKLCRFYLRGMCFFGENCTNFHDKPEKDFISCLRENEVLNEKKTTDDSFDMNLIDLPIELAKNKEIHFDALKIDHSCSDFSNQHKSYNDTSSSLKSEEQHNVPFNNFPKPEELFTVSHCRSTKSAKINKEAKITVNPCKSEKSTNLTEDPCSSTKLFELDKELSSFAKSTKICENPSCSSLKSVDITKDPWISTKCVEFNNEPCRLAKSADLTKDFCNSSISVKITKNPCSSSNWEEFNRTLYNSSNSNFLKNTNKSIKSKKNFRESNTASKSKIFEKGTFIFAKSKAFAGNNYSSDNKEFIKSDDSSRSRYTCSYSQTERFSNASSSYKKSKEFFGAQCSSNQRTENLTSVEQFESTDVSFKFREFTRNSVRLKKQSRNLSYSMKLDQFGNVANSIKHSEQSKITDDLKSKEKESFNKTTYLSYSNVQSNDATTSKTRVTVTYNKHTGPEKSCYMTRKQSKSQRKLKSENTQPRLFFKRLFFRTPVPVTHISKN